VATVPEGDEISESPEVILALGEAIADAAGADPADVEIGELVIIEEKRRFLQKAGEDFEKNNHKVSRFSAKFGIKSNSPTNSKLVEQTMMQPGFGDAVVSGWNTSSRKQDIQFGGAVNKQVSTREVHERDESEDALLAKYSEELRNHWELATVVAVLAMLLTCALMYMLRCCCCASSGANNSSFQSTTKKVVIV